MKAKQNNFSQILRSSPEGNRTRIKSLGKSCSNSNNQWITTDIVIFVEYL